MQLEIRHAVAVHVALQDAESAVDRAQLSGDAAEGGGADKGEGLVAVQHRVGVDPGQVDQVEAGLEPRDDVAQRRSRSKIKCKDYF